MLEECGLERQCRLDCALLKKAEVLRGEGEPSSWTLHVRGGIPLSMLRRGVKVGILSKCLSHLQGNQGQGQE